MGILKFSRCFLYTANAKYQRTSYRVCWELKIMADTWCELLQSLDLYSGIGNEDEANTKDFVMNGSILWLGQW